MYFRIAKFVVLIGLQGALLLDAKNSLPTNELVKIFHHQGNNSTLTPSIELGKVVFYFKQEPVINQLPNSKQDDSQITLFFPTMKASHEVLPSLTALNSANNPYYTVFLEEVTKPIKGIKCTISFDPGRVSFDYSTFDSIKMNKGIVMRFFNKPMLELINKQDRSVLKVVSAHKNVPSVVIDCGHGGDDAGALGFFSIREKDITMKVGMQVADLLKKKGFNVQLTRSGDYSVALDERTTLANKINDAQLLVSIHANFSPNEAASGIETFCLTSNLFKSCYQNDISFKKLAREYMHDLNKKSILLAHAVQQNTVQTIKKKHNVLDRSVKYSVSQMLVGPNIPSALIEIGFVSNKQEASLLNDTDYQLLIAQGISKGILSYVAALTA